MKLWNGGMAVYSTTRNALFMQQKSHKNGIAGKLENKLTGKSKVKEG